jgi:ADP-ribose pyrophosphatase YjhB (NUDIX family)
MVSPNIEQKQVSRVIVLYNNKVLLVEKKDEPGLFEIPGGQRKPSEGMRRAAQRELREETGLIVHSKALQRWGYGKLITTHDSSECVAWTVYVLKLDAKNRAVIRPQNEIIKCRWYTLTKLACNPKIERKSAFILKFFHLLT